VLLLILQADETSYSTSDLLSVFGVIRSRRSNNRASARADACGATEISSVDIKAPHIEND
jgi:hypothetical protein